MAEYWDHKLQQQLGGRFGVVCSLSHLFTSSHPVRHAQPSRPGTTVKQLETLWSWEWVLLYEGLRTKISVMGTFASFYVDVQSVSMVNVVSWSIKSERDSQTTDSSCACRHTLYSPAGLTQDLEQWQRVKSEYFMPALIAKCRHHRHNYFNHQVWLMHRNLYRWDRCRDRPELVKQCMTYMQWKTCKSTDSKYTVHNYWGRESVLWSNNWLFHYRSQHVSGLMGALCGHIYGLSPHFFNNE